MCQDTGTAIVMGKKSEGVLTGADDGEAISRGVYDAYTKLNLRYSQLAPLTTWEEKNTGTNLPAQIELYSTPSPDGKPEYKFLFMAKGGGSANKSFLFQETKAVLNPTRMLSFLDEKIRSLGTAACPPYHLAIVIGGTSAEFALKTAKYASAHYLDNLPTSGSMSAHGFRDVELEEEVFKLTQSFGIGAQFGGKYFCHDVRVVRLPRHGASCPVAIAVSCSADRQALGQDHRRGRVPRAARGGPRDVPPRDRARGGRRRPDRPEPADGRDPRRAHPAPRQDAAVADRPAGRRPRHRARQDQGAPRRGRGDAGVPPRPRGLLRRAGQDPRGLRQRLLRPDDGRADGLLRRAVPGRRRVEGDAREGQPLQGRDRRPARPTAASTSARSAAPPPASRRTASSRSTCWSTPSSAWRRSGRSRSRTSRRSSSSTTRATTSSPTPPAPSPCRSPGSGCAPGSGSTSARWRGTSYESAARREDTPP